MVPSTSPAVTSREVIRDETGAPARDVVVVGSGGAGLMAACRAADHGFDVLVVESADLIGGTTAWSGGQLWVPDSAPMRRAGLSDDRSDALSYLDRVSLGRTPRTLLAEFVSAGPQMIDYLESALGLPLVSIARHDYHPAWCGAAYGRSVEPVPVAAAELGSWAALTRTSPTRGPVTSQESRTGLDAETIRRREETDVRTQGAGLIAALLKAALRRGVRFRLGLRLQEATAVPEGFVLSGGRDGSIKARNVVLAAGGFAGDAQWRARFLPLTGPVPTGPAGNLGDGIGMGLRLGGQLRDMGEAWWTPAVDTGDSSAPHRNIVRELAYPGSILVNAAGRRFVNEASSYNDLAKRLFDFDPHEHIFPNATAWMVFDSGFRRTRPVLGVGPDSDCPPWMIEASDLDALAAKTGIDSNGLADTVESFNDAALVGVDPDFHRGQNPHDRFNGDGSHTPNPCLGALSTAPFYAIRVQLGANGTKGGLIVDTGARVVSSSGRPVPGLFAVGETAASLMGPGYAGSGASLGPSLTAGFVVADHLLPAPSH